MNIFNFQFGFLREHSVVHALSALQNDISNGLNNGRITSLVAIDLKAAFDSIWHEGLIHKMCQLGFKPNIIKIIQNMLTGRSFRVCVDGHLSDVFDMPAGVPQGSVLGPLLFNLYLFDIPIRQDLKCIQYADDITVYVTHSDPGLAQNSLTIQLVDLSKYFKAWRLNLNKVKTEFINILGLVSDSGIKLRKHARNMKISCEGHLLPHSKSVRLLGLVYQQNGRFTSHIKTRLQKANRSLYFLKRLLRNRKIPIKTKSNIYKTYIRPVLTFAAPVWCSIPLVSSHQMELLRMFERKVLRFSTNTRRDIGCFKHIRSKILYEKAKTKRIDRFMVKLAINFVKKASLSGFDKIKNLVSEPSAIDSKYKTVTYFSDLVENNLYNLNSPLPFFNQRYNSEPGSVYILDEE